MELLGLTLEVLGTVIIAITALSVHHHVARHHKIDEGVIIQMNKERKIGFLGVFLVIIGFLIQAIDKI